MDFGSLDAFVHETQRVVFDSGEIQTPVTTITIPNLNGDVDEEYELIIRIVNGFSGVSDYSLKLNGDTAYNYGRQYVTGVGTTASAGRGVVQGIVTIGHAANLAELTIGHLVLDAKSGKVRTAVKKTAYEISGTTVGGVYASGDSWNNTTSNITSLVVSSNSALGIGVGSRVILLKKVVLTSGTKTGVMNVKGKPKGMWEEIYNNTLLSAVTSVTIPNLSGNTDILYRIRCRFIGVGNVGNYQLTFNSDTSANYGLQNLAGTDSTANSGRGIGSSSLTLGYTATNNNVTYAEYLIYAKSGYTRIGVCRWVADISGTLTDAIYLSGGSWDNSANEIIQMVITAQANQIGVGSNIVLERLNL